MAMLQLVTLRYGTTAMAVLQGTTMWRSNDGSATGCDAAVLLQGVTLQWWQCYRARHYNDGNVIGCDIVMLQWWRWCGAAMMVVLKCVMLRHAAHVTWALQAQGAKAHVTAMILLYNDGKWRYATLQQWRALLSKFLVLFFLLNSLKTFYHMRAHFCAWKREKMKKKKRARGGGLKPALLVNRNVTTQVPSNNTSSNTRSNLHSLWQ